MFFVWMFLLPLVILFLIFLGAGVTLFRALLRFFGFSSGASFHSGKSSGSRHSKQTSSTYSSSNATDQRKIIGDDEGEYVEFEEVKE